MKFAVRHKGVWYAVTCSCRVQQIRASHGLVCCACCGKPLAKRLPPAFITNREAAE